MTQTALPAAAAGTWRLGSLTVNRLGFGAMRVTGSGIWGPPPKRDVAIAVLRRAVELGVNFIDTADSYGPDVAVGFTGPPEPGPTEVVWHSHLRRTGSIGVASLGEDPSKGIL